MPMEIKTKINKNLMVTIQNIKLHSTANKIDKYVFFAQIFFGVIIRVFQALLTYSVAI
jgi:hypothetical protein